jgi:hypothetical protein
MPTMDATACAVATTASSVAGPRLARHGTADATGDATGVAGEDDPFPEGGPGPAQGWRFQGVGPLLPEGVQVRVNGQPGWLERCDARMEGGLAGVPWLDGSAASYAPVVMPRVQVKYRVRMADMADVRAAMAGTDGLAARVAERAGRAAMVAMTDAGTWPGPCRYTAATVTMSTAANAVTVPVTAWGTSTLGTWGGTCYNLDTDMATDTTWTVSATSATATAEVTFYAYGWDGIQAAARDGVAWAKHVPPVPEPRQRLREMLRSRMAPMAVGGREPDWTGRTARRHLEPTGDFRELRARDTLARVIGEDAFRRYARDGFVTVRGKSGKTYQIFPAGGFTRVHGKGGQREDSLCVVLSGDFPPTDSLIVRFLMILNDEKGFHERAIKHRAEAARQEARMGGAESQVPGLADAWRGLKTAWEGRQQARKARAG